MFVKVALLVCCQLFLKGISAQFIGPAYDGFGPYGAPCGGLAEPFGFGAATLSASNGGGFAVTSISPIAPTGISVTSENAYDGAVSIAGQIPFLSAVTLEGALPSVGAGAITYGCGNGNVAILSEDLTPAFDPYGAPMGYGPYGYGPSPLGYGCGCGAIY